MGSKSDIEWTDASWNPIRARNLKTGKVGWHCEHATTGCEFCYAEGFNLRLGTGLAFKPGHRGDLEIFLDEEMLAAPLRWKKPRMIFVGSMTDLFADFVKDEWLDKMFAVMALSTQHTFQVLTKRAERMRAYLNGPWTGDGVMARIADATWQFAPTRKQLPEPPVVTEVPIGPRLANGEPEFGWRRFLPIGPLKNVWLGVSAERQQEADERIPLLLRTPAAVRFVSAEPLLGPIDFTRVPFASGDPRHRRDALSGHSYLYGRGVDGNPDATIKVTKPLLSRLDWVIVGGESGRNARPFHLTWAESIIDQCETAGVACFIKQLGACAISDGYPMHYSDRKGGDWSEWPESLRVREFPVTLQSRSEAA